MTAKKTTKPAQKAAKASPKKTPAKQPDTKAPKKASSAKETTKKVSPKTSVISNTKPVAKKSSKPAKAVKEKEVSKTTEKSTKKTKAVKDTQTTPAKSEKKKSARREMSVQDILRPEETRMVASTRVEKPTHGALYVRSGRHFFTEDRSIIEMPELIAAQLDSYQSFIEHGLREALESVFPITDFSEERVEIHFKGMELEEPRYSAKECRRKNLNYESYLRVKLQMLNKETGEIKEDTVFMGGVPLMTNKGTFIVNGVERIVVHQIIKADGISFEADAGVYTAKIKPKKGAWLEFSVDKRGVITVRIDKKRKMPASTLLRAFGLERCCPDQSI
jgi:hypothetical protein